MVYALQVANDSSNLTEFENTPWTAVNATLLAATAVSTCRTSKPCCRTNAAGPGGSNAHRYNVWVRSTLWLGNNETRLVQEEQRRCLDAPPSNDKYCSPAPYDYVAWCSEPACTDAGRCRADCSDFFRYESPEQTVLAMKANMARQANIVYGCLASAAFLPMLACLFHCLPFLCEYVLFLYDILASACKRASSLKRRLFARRVPPAVKREQSLRLSQHEEGPPLKEEAAAPATAPAEDGVAMATAIPAVRSTNE